MAEIISRCSLLAHLNMADMESLHSGLEMSDEQALVDAICSRSSLVRLRLVANNFNPVFLVYLSSKLWCLRHLQDLSIGGTSMVSTALSAFCQAVPHCPRLTRLRISHLPFLDMTDMKMLSGLLPKCKGLSEIILSQNKFDCNAVEMFAEILPLCSSLQDLSFASNKIGNDAVQDLVQVLPKCTSLLKLDLAHNCITQQGALTLKEKRDTFPHLGISIYANDVPFELVEELRWSMQLSPVLSVT
mmetsp:Transcript_2479/g.3994  ORF Transcript_2479/g.3994 Transcript_2479/m.3994 type:complete len:244 (-) Transcript_2479:1371-2102(-)